MSTKKRNGPGHLVYIGKPITRKSIYILESKIRSRLYKFSIKTISLIESKIYPKVNGLTLRNHVRNVFKRLKNDKLKLSENKHQKVNDQINISRDQRIKERLGRIRGLKEFNNMLDNQESESNTIKAFEEDCQKGKIITKIYEPSKIQPSTHGDDPYVPPPMEE